MLSVAARASWGSIIALENIFADQLFDVDRRFGLEDFITGLEDHLGTPGRDFDELVADDTLPANRRDCIGL